MAQHMFRPDRLTRAARRHHVVPPQRSLISAPIAPRAAAPHPFASLLRALLRECTYLPDPQARDHFHADIVARFRRYRGTTTRPTGPGTAAARIPPAPAQLDKLQREARTELALLQRANGCCHDAFDAVLARAYGRRGPLRQQWLRPYLRPDPRSDAAATTSDPLAGLRPVDPRLPLPSAIRALAEAQVPQRAHLAPPDQLRHVDPAIAPTNLWGRPMPVVRVANRKMRAQRLVLRKVLPPISRALWDRLNRLVQTRCVGMIEPRPRRSPPRAEPSPPRQDRPRVAPLPPLHTAASAHPPSDPDDVAPPFRGSPDSLHRGNLNRFLYRRYRKLLPQCAIIRKHPAKPGQWQVGHPAPSCRQD